MDETTLWVVAAGLLFFAMQGGMDFNWGVLGALAVAGYFVVGEAQHH